VIMEREHVGADEAFGIMRRLSQRSGRSFRERAEDIVSSTRRPRPGLDPGDEESP
jgi:hypothetical protein